MTLSFVHMLRLGVSDRNGCFLEPISQRIWAHDWKNVEITSIFLVSGCEYDSHDFIRSRICTCHKMYKIVSWSDQEQYDLPLFNESLVTSMAPIAPWQAHVLLSKLFNDMTKEGYMTNNCIVPSYHVMIYTTVTHGHFMIYIALCFGNCLALPPGVIQMKNPDVLRGYNKCPIKWFQFNL